MKLYGTLPGRNMMLDGLTKENYAEKRREIVEANSNLLGVVLRDKEIAVDSKLQYLKDIMYQIQTRGLIADISAIDVANEANPGINYQNRFAVSLGENDNTEYKFGKMLSAISKLGSDDAGIMDLSEGDKVYYNPN